MKANGRDEAWKIADRIFPTDYQKDDAASERAGYPIYETTSTDEKFAGFHISDLNTRLELNMGKETVTIWIEEKTNFEDLLKVVTEKRRSAEIEERQKYNYYCSRTNNAWNWTKEQDDEFERQWNEVIVKMHTLKDLENTLKRAIETGVLE